MSAADDREAKRQARLRELVAPGQAAVVTMELQRGVVGARALMPALVDVVAEAGVVDAAGRVCVSARAAGVRVVHAVVEHRPDGAGATTNCAIFAMGDKLRREEGIVPLAVGTEGADLMPQLGPEPEDIVVARIHGMTPFMSTSLDQILRNLGVTTVVAVGVSVNIGIFGLCLNAVDLGYDVVLVRDAVAGVPPDYAHTIINNSLSLLTTVATADEVCALWDDLT